MPLNPYDISRPNYLVRIGGIDVTSMVAGDGEQVKILRTELQNEEPPLAEVEIRLEGPVDLGLPYIPNPAVGERGFINPGINPGPWEPDTLIEIFIDRGNGLEPPPFGGQTYIREWDYSSGRGPVRRRAGARNTHHLCQPATVFCAKPRTTSGRLSIDRDSNQPA